MTVQLQPLTPIAHTVAWSALIAGALACVAVVVAAPLVHSSAPLGRWQGIGAVALCGGAAFLLDDPAGAMTGATAMSQARRRLLRVAVALPLLCGVWAGSLWYATSADGALFGPDSRAALSMQFSAMLALTLAASALALRAMPEELGGWTGALAPTAVLAAALTLPERWTLLALPADPAWHAAHQRWTALLVLGLLALAYASREPVTRSRHKLPD